MTTRPPLTSLFRWICWKIDPANTQNKEPFDPRTNRHAACDDPSTWCDYKTAKAAVNAGRYDAIGFVLGKEVGLTIIDFDGCRNPETGEIADWATPEIEALSSCTESSYSQTGIHVLVYGAIPRNIKRTKDHVGIELHDHDKMFALTGKFLDGHTKIEDRDVSALHQRVVANLVGPQAPRPPLIAFAYNDAKFQSLCDANFSHWGGGPSEAVQSVLVTLARLHNCDRNKMAEEFEKTKLHDLWEAKEKGGKWTRLREKELDRTIDFVKTHVAPEPKKLEFKLPKVVGGDFDFVINPLEGEIDGWMPLGEISLLLGPSGSGKTTWMCPLLVDQKASRNVFGHTTNGYPYLLLLQDRSPASLRRTFRRLHLDINETPYRLLRRGKDSVAQAVANVLETTQPMPRVVFIEGLDMAADDAGDMKATVPMLQDLQQVAEHYHVAVVGSVGCPKLKPKDKYTSLREMAYGSVVWGRMCETMIALQKDGGQDTADKTVLTVLPRNAKHETFTLEFVGGRLVSAKETSNDEDDALQTLDDKMEYWARQRKEPFTYYDFMLAFPGSDTATRRRVKLLEARKLVARVPGGKSAKFMPVPETTFLNVTEENFVEARS